MVRDVEELCANLQAALFAPPEVLHHREVGVDEPGSLQDTGSGITERERGWKSKRTGIEVLVDRSFAIRKVAVANTIGTIRSACIRVVGRERGSKRPSALERLNEFL